jgi:phosphoglycerate kinase
MFQMNKQTIKDVDWQGRKALVRVDFNVPQDKATGAITDDARIRAALPTIQYLLDHGAAVILMSHLGRPKDGPDPKYSMKVTADHLATLISAPVKFVGQTTGPDAEAAAVTLRPGEVLVLENTRFDKRETKNDPGMSQELARMGDVYVNDAFGSAHRAHASTEGVAHYLPAVAGFLMEKELTYLGKALEDPERPFVAILGGAKISDKIGVISNLLKQVDAILIGGGMANTFLAAQGYNMGKSLVEAEALDTARQLIDQDSDIIQLPVDLVVADKFAADAAFNVVPVNEVPFRRVDGTRHRPGHDCPLLEPAGRRQDRSLERADGRLRVCGVCQRHGGHRRDAGQPQTRHHDHRRRRQRSGRARGRAGGCHVPRQHRRRRQPGVFGRDRAAGRGGVE